MTRDRRVDPAPSPGHGPRHQAPLGRMPSLHRLRRRKVHVMERDVVVIARLSGPTFRNGHEQAQALVGAAPATQTSKTRSVGSSSLVTILAFGRPGGDSMWRTWVFDERPRALLIRTGTPLNWACDASRWPWLLTDGRVGDRQRRPSSATTLLTLLRTLQALVGAVVTKPGRYTGLPMTSRAKQSAQPARRRMCRQSRPRKARCRRPRALLDHCPSILRAEWRRLF
jgi:hypothetical protein